MLLEEGQIIRETYEVERFLGDGAFAEIYRVKHRFLGRQAMKVFKMVGMTVEEIDDLMGEAMILSRMRHPNVIRVHEANVVETAQGIRGFFTMDYIAGGSLEQFWRSHGMQFVPVETVVAIMKQVCRGLTLAHCENPPIIHRDIKPANILVGYDRSGLRAQITDFGLAKKVNPLTFLATVRGTPGFKAPEALAGQQMDSCAGDVWSLGTTMYLLLTDRMPYTESETPDISAALNFDLPLIPPSRLNYQVDQLLDQIVFKALEQNQKKRYHKAVEMLKVLERWKPKPLGTAKQPGKHPISGTTKMVLGLHTAPDEKKAREQVAQARELACQSWRLAEALIEAADMMEEAFNKWPDLRSEYEYQIKLWRRGISM